MTLAAKMKISSHRAFIITIYVVCILQLVNSFHKLGKMFNRLQYKSLHLNSNRPGEILPSLLMEEQSLFRKALELTSSPTASLQDKQSALQSLEKANKIIERDITWYNIATILDCMNKPQECMNAYENVLSCQEQTTPLLRSASFSNLLNLYIEYREDIKAVQLCQQYITESPEDDNAWSSYGVTLRNIGEYNVSKTCFENALLLSQGRNSIALSNLGYLYSQQGKNKEAINMYLRALDEDMNDISSHYNLALLYMETKDYDSATRYFSNCLEIDSSYSQAKYHLAALSKDNNLKSTYEYAPSEYISTLFDYYASQGYDIHMQEVLQYKGHELIGDAFMKYSGLIQEKKEYYTMKIAELGVGTGLVGAKLRELGYNGKLFGCDLSPSMVEIATNRIYTPVLTKQNALLSDKEQADRYMKPGSKIYHQVDYADCTQYLCQLVTNQTKVDAVLAGDVFVYIGNLTPIFQETSKILKTNGLFIFTIEALHSNTSNKEEKKADTNTDNNNNNNINSNDNSYILQESGRFAHAKKYIESLTDQYHMKVIDIQETIVRYQNNQPVISYICTLQKQS